MNTIQYSLCTKKTKGFPKNKYLKIWAKKHNLLLILNNNYDRIISVTQRSLSVMKRQNCKKLIFIASITVSIFLIIITLCCFFLFNNKLTKAIKDAGFTIIRTEKTDDHTYITISAGTEDISADNIIIARYAKSVLDSSEYENISIKIQLKNGKNLVQLDKTSEQNKEQTPLSLYMEESLLKFKINYILNKETNGISGIRITEYPQCYIEENPEKSSGRTVNIALKSDINSLENNSNFLKSFFSELNEQGASVYVYNSAYYDAEGKILRLESVNTINGEKIVINNYDTDK